MDQGQLHWIANFIWGIADDVLRDVYVRGKYRDVILPMVVIRRLDAMLEPTKQAVLAVYDGACGTGGMLTVAEERLHDLAREHGKDVSIHLFGQEVNPETYAITKADLLLKGEGDEAENFSLGSTLS